MRMIVNMTTTMNSMAARENDSTNCFQRGEWPMFMELARETGALVWGRRTHQIVRGYGPEAIRAFDGIGRIVLTHDGGFALEDGWSVGTTPHHALDILAGQGHEAVLIGGGGTTNASFLASGLVDEVVLFIESVLLGQGVPAFAAQPYEVRLDLHNVERVDGHLVKLWYRVLRDT